MQVPNIRGRQRRPPLRTEVFIPSLFVLTVLVTLFVVMGEAGGSSHIQYSTVPGYFLQDDPNTNDSNFNYTTVNLGLIDRSYPTIGRDSDQNLTQWQRFKHEVYRLNRESGRNVQYKLLYMGRHGEGLHNVAESFYGTPAWNCYRSKQDGNGTVVWADAHLTQSGVEQAEIANRFWAKEIEEQRIPTPQTYYTSPLTRCLDTANITFSGLDLPARHPFVPTVKELLREAIGVHTCDRRSTKTYIHNRDPTYDFEYGFTEDDELWRADARETDPALDTRMTTLLDDVFSHDDSTFVSFTSHSGALGGVLRVIGHRKFNLATGAVIPALVKAEKVSGSRSPGNFTYAPAPSCGPSGP